MPRVNGTGSDAAERGALMERFAEMYRTLRFFVEPDPTKLDPADESHVFMIEKWESAEHLGRHGATDHIKALGMSGTPAGAPKVTVLQQAAFGDAGLGTL